MPPLNRPIYIALHLYCDSSFGGAERRLLRAYSGVAEKVDVDLIIREQVQGAFLKSCEEAGIDLDDYHRVIIINSGKKILSDIKALLRCCDKQYTSHVFFDYSQFNALAIKLLARFSDVGSVFTSANCAYGIDGTLSNLPGKPGAFQRLLCNASQIDVLYPNQQPLFQRVTAQSNVSVTPGTFTDLELCRPAKEKRRKVVFLSARLDEIKNPQLFIDAIGNCKEHLISTGYEAYLCGVGTDYEKYNDQVIEMGLSGLMHMPGYVKSSEMLADAQMVCVLSESENYPSQVIAEGCACGCYIIATDVGNTASIIEDGFGTLVDCNPGDVSRAICDYIQLTEEEKASIIDNARQYALEHFQRSTTVDYFLRINELVQDGKR